MHRLKNFPNNCINNNIVCNHYDSKNIICNLNKMNYNDSKLKLCPIYLDKSRFIKERLDEELCNTL